MIERKAAAHEMAEPETMLQQLLRAGLVLPALAALAACENPAKQSYWSMQTMRGGRTSEAMACANEMVRRRLAGPKGGVGVKTEGMKARSTTTGDPKTDFVVTTVIEMTAGGETEHFEEESHFRKAADVCPPGWTVGDVGVVGEHVVMNALTGEMRVLDEPVQGL